MQLDVRTKAILGEIVEGGVFLLEQNGLPAMIARLPVANIENKPVGYGEIYFIDYNPEGPLAVFVFRLFDDPQSTSTADASCAWDTFLNPSNPNDRRVLDKLAHAQYIHLHIFSTERGIPYVGSKRLIWQDQHRAGVQGILDRSRGKTTLWPNAKNRYIKEHPLS